MPSARPRSHAQQPTHASSPHQPRPADLARHVSDPRRRRRARSRRRAAALVVVALVAFAGSGAVLVGARLHSNVTTVGSLAGLIAAPTPDAQPAVDQPAADAWGGHAVNFVLLGSDDRSGENGSIGGVVAGMRSDTTLVVHVAADRSRVEIVSIPRDSEAHIPACHLDRDPAGAMSSPRVDKFNSAFDTGAETGDLGLAAACTLSTIAAMTGVAVTDFALVDFAGFQGMVEAIGGVRVCVPTPLRDYKHNTGLNLDAGWHDLDGPQALDYVRARYVTGSDGSDTQRIVRQQKFIGTVARKVVSSAVLTSPTSLTRFLLAATRSLTTSDELLARAPGLLWSLRGLDPASVTFVTVPWGSGTHGRIVWTHDATELWARIGADEPIGGTASAATPAGAAGSTGAAGSAGAAGSTGATPGGQVAGSSTSPPAPAGSSTTSAPEGGAPAAPAATQKPAPGLVLRSGADADDQACG